MNISGFTNQLPYPLLNRYGSAAIIIGANIVFEEIAIKITNLLEVIFSNFLDKISDCPGLIRVISLISIIISLNIALTKILKFPFGPFIIGSLSLLTCIFYTYKVEKVEIKNK